MKIPRFWARGRSEARTPAGEIFPVRCWRWSSTSQEEAERLAQEAARRAARRLATGEPLPNEYWYSERQPREEIVEEIVGSDGAVIAVLTRNAYGSIVMNTRDLMFIDVDVPPEQAGSRLVRAVKGLFGGSTEPAEQRTLRRIEAVAKGYPQYTLRVYRTHGGYRCAIVNRQIDPASQESRLILDAFGADPLYVRLCKSQENYRARLTPKFWRCGADRPPNRFPWESRTEEQLYRIWETAYADRCTPFAVCRFVDQFGNANGSADVRRLIERHDTMTHAHSERPLA